jgi:uncharacterized protein (DUF697 family)
MVHSKSGRSSARSSKSSKPRKVVGRAKKPKAPVKLKAKPKTKLRGQRLPSPIATLVAPEPVTVRSRKVVSPEAIAAIIERYTWAAAFAMFAIPVPGVDMVATFSVWGAMIRRIARAYGEEISREDGARLASELFKDAVLTGFAWFGSTKVATTILKFIPFAGTITAYAVDAAVAAAGAKRITASVGNAAALYYGTGRAAAPSNLGEHVEHLTRDPALWQGALGMFRRKKA